MISIIISSVNQNHLKAVKQNIKESIGIPHEVLSYDNSKGDRGICSVYNQGTREAKYTVLCFMHEDIELKTKNWGQTVLDTFEKNKKLGLLGIAGGGYKTLAPSQWGATLDAGFFINMIQSFKYSRSNKPAERHLSNPKNESLSRCAVIDGVWMCTKKEIALEIPFDEKLFQKFHCYDLDFSLSVGLNYEVAVGFDILLEHFSEGNYDHTWVEETVKLQNKWQNKLPLNISKESQRVCLDAEKKAFYLFSTG